MQRQLDTAFTRRLLEHEGLTIEFTGLQGDRVVASAKRVPHVEWAVLVQVPAAEAFRQVTHLRNVTMLIVATLLVGVGLLAYVLGLLIARPLNRLTGGAARVAGGDLAVDLPVVGGGELGYVTEVFNDMVARLRDSHHELERLSITDDLTGLFNRRYVMEALANEVRRSRRLEHPFTLLMLDVDHFKEYNDAYGHLAGDAALARVAAILKESTRDVDCAARYGGEEFVILLPETEAAGATETAQRIQARLTGDELVGGKLTLSVGVAQFPEDGESPEDLLAGADAALHQAKREGRNRVLRAALARRAPPDQAQEDPAAAPAFVHDAHPLVHVGIAGQRRTRIHRKHHLGAAARPVAHVAVRGRLQLHGHGERHFARTQRRPPFVPQAALTRPGDALRLVREVQRPAVVLLREFGARLLQQGGGLCQVGRRLCRRGGAERLHRDFAFRDGRRRFGAAGDGLQLRHGAHHLLARFVEARLQLLELRVALEQPQLEPGSALLQCRISGGARCRGRVSAGPRRDFRRVRRAGRQDGRQHGPKKSPRRRALGRGETAPRGHPAASCESACCCIGSCACALTHTPGWGIVTTKPSVTRSGFAWYAARASRHSAGSCPAERSGSAIALPTRPTTVFSITSVSGRPAGSRSLESATWRAAGSPAEMIAVE